MRPSARRRTAAIGAFAALSFAGAGVASATTPPTEPTDTTTADSSATGDSMTETTMTGETPATSGPTGPLCAAAYAAEGGGDMAGDSTMTTGDATATADTTMATEGTTATVDTATAGTEAGGGTMAEAPVATAAGMNPLLSTLVTAVTEAGLVDTLNGPGPFTVLAPVDSAFDKIDPATLEAVLGDPTGALTEVLSYHVIPEQLTSADLAAGGSFATVQGEEVTFEMRNDTLVINDGFAAVQCMDIPTANATVYLIDTVLLPPSMAEAATGESETTTEATTAGTATTGSTPSDTMTTEPMTTDSMTTDTMVTATTTG